jgi:hypothetical protein
MEIQWGAIDDPVRRFNPELIDLLGNNGKNR